MAPITTTPAVTPPAMIATEFELPLPEAVVEPPLLDFEFGF